MNFTLLYPNFKCKAVTFSYDDGVIQDKVIIEIFNKYNVKATFNLNYGKSGSLKTRVDKDGKEIDCSHLNLHDNYSLYRKHEIANHTYSHPHLETIDKDEQRYEYSYGKEKLEDVFGPLVVYGSAYPYGTYNKDTLEVEKELGVKYARTTRSTYSFNLPFDWLLWNPTIHHRDVRLKEVAKEFYQTNQELALLYIWGHAYEFAIDHNFDLLDELCADLVKRDDIAFMTNYEVYEYTHAANMVYYRDKKFHNPSDLDVYIKVEDKLVIVPSQGEIDYD